MSAVFRPLSQVVTGNIRPLPFFAACRYKGVSLSVSPETAQSMSASVTHQWRGDDEDNVLRSGKDIARTTMPCACEIAL